MLFSDTTLKIKIQNKWKGDNSFLVIKNTLNTSIITSKNFHRVSPEFYEKRASLCTSRKKKASITVEAALAIPVFFFALLCILYLLEIISVQMNVRMGMHAAAYAIANETGTSIYVTSTEIEEAIIQGIGEENLENSIILNGSSGLDCSGSTVSILTGIVELEVVYDVQLPFLQFGELGMTFVETMTVKGWTGYASGAWIGTDQIVYITDNQSVYHVDAQCTHLQLSISSASYGEISSLSNEYGEGYTPCALCTDSSSKWSDGTTIYIAESGSHYHSSLSCSGLKRTVYEVLLSEVIGKGVCSRCGQ